MRLYSFVAGLYLTPLQCGLQTAHVVSELSIAYGSGSRFQRYNDWASGRTESGGKTIIILNALNSKGVRDANSMLIRYAAHFDLPVAMFCEDEQSLDGAATAAGIIVPAYFYEVEQIDEGYRVLCAEKRDKIWIADSLCYEFISFLKSYRLV